MQASDMEAGAVLSQLDNNEVEHVVCYSSRLLSKAESNYCVTHKELLAFWWCFLNILDHAY